MEGLTQPTPAPTVDVETAARARVARIRVDDAARHHARDYERLVQHSKTLITWAAITLMTRRQARNSATPGWPRKTATADG